MGFTITNPRRFFLFIILFVSLILIICFQFVWGSGDIQKSGEFTIEAGQGASMIWERLKADGYILRTLPARYYASRLGAAGNLQAGTYKLEVGESLQDVITRFATGDAITDEVTITFPEGFTLQQMAERAAAKNIGTVDQYISQATVGHYQQQFSFLQDLPVDRSLEGYLFPDTYHVFVDDTPADLIQRQLATFENKVTADLRRQAETSGRTLDDIIIMASIIEREVQLDKDMALVSGVLWKRIEDGEGLYVDATIRYALDKQTGPLTVQDLAVDSPFNTRLYRDLPPAPIANPSLRAIQAALNPEASPYYYYLSAPSGETIFAETNDQHNANKVKYLQ